MIVQRMIERRSVPPCETTMATFDSLYFAPAFERLRSKVFYNNGLTLSDWVSRKEILKELKALKNLGLLGVSWIDILHDARAALGDDRYLRFLLARAYHQRKLERTKVAFKRAEREERKAWWLAEGRAITYRKNHPFGGDHLFLLKALQRRTGCVFDDGETWDETPVSASNGRHRHRGRRTTTVQTPRPAPRPDRLARERVQAERDLDLARLLRAKIVALASKRTGVPVSFTFVNKKFVNISKYVQLLTTADPQMEGLAGEQTSQIISSNVVLSESNPSSSSTAARPQFRFDWHPLCSTEKTIDYKLLTDRWTKWKCIDWTAEQGQFSEIASAKMDLPVDFIDVKDGSMPMFVPFKIHKYFKGDLDIKFHINSNKFQVGQLQIAWQYLEKYDGNPFTNIYSRCQLPHVLLNAGSSNEATLSIPFKYPQPYMLTSNRKGLLDPLYLGTLRWFVISPLQTPTKNPQKCSITVYIKFSNVQFTGMTDGGIVLPQMEGAAAAMIAAKAYDKFLGDKNCDNPSVNTNPSYIVPTAAHSWSAGTGLREHLHSLRLDNSTIGVGRTGIDDSETNIAIPARTYGMLKPFSWKSSVVDSNKHGYLLWSADVHPQIEKSLIYSVSNPGKMDVYALPPVNVVASLFKMWRGSLEFKFDIIASSFHTGRIMCAYLPGFYGDASKITIDQARNCPYVELEIADSTSFTFVVPYIAPNVWWPRKYTGPHKYGEESAPSKLVMYVLNPLVPMESVVPDINIIPYVRAGPDFEVAVPVQPSIGLSDNPVNNVELRDKIYPTTGSFPCYATNYKGFGEDKYYIMYEGTAAFGTASTFHAPESKLKDTEYYVAIVDSTYKFKCTMTYNDPSIGKTTQYVGQIVLWPTASGNYGIPFPPTTYGKAQSVALAKALHEKQPEAECLKHCIPYVEDGLPSSSVLSDCLCTPKYLSNELDDYAFQGDDPRYFNLNVLQPTMNLPSTSAGNFNFNESFDDFKTLCRRYQLYFDKTVTLKKSYTSSAAVAAFPVIPSGLALDVTNSHSVANICRDGHIPIVASGYIYYRGSIRLKLVFSSDDIALMGSKVWIQHHPDSKCVGRDVKIWPNINDEDSVKSHTYGFYIQAMNVNSIVELEIPFYHPGLYGLTRMPSAEAMKCDQVCRLFSLGNILLGFSVGNLSKNVDFNLQVYYSISDDFSFSTFRGFPQMVYVDEVWPVGERQPREITWITAEPQMEEPQSGDPQMFKWIGEKVIGTSYTPDRLIGETISEVSKSIARELVNSAKDKISNSTPKELVAQILDNKILMSSLGNLAHIFNNPTPSTIAISVCNIVISILGSSLLKITDLISHLTKFLHAYWSKFVGSMHDIAFQGDEIDGTSAAYAFCSLIFTAVCALFGCTFSAPSSFPSLIRNINSMVSLSNNVSRLLQNCGDLIKYCIQYVSNKLNPELRFASALASDVPEIKQWYDECMYLLDVRNKERFLYDGAMVTRVFDCCILGALVTSSGLDRSIPGGKLIHDAYKEIKKLQTDLFERGIHPDVRFESFPLWITGEPGIGKSHIVKKLAFDILKSINYKQSGSLIYDIPSGAKYWSGCQQPAVLVSDDILQVKGTRSEEELANLFAICSSSVLNPPMAAVEEKSRRINPLLYIMLSNASFPDVSSLVISPRAVYRRRKFLIKAQFTMDVLAEYPDITDAGELPKHRRDKLQHLEFFVARKVTDVDTAYDGPFTIQELSDKIVEKFKKYYERERESFKDRMKYMYSLDPNYDETNIIEEFPELAHKPSLKEQIETYKEIIKTRLDVLEDPEKEPDMWTYIRKFRDRVIKVVDPQMEEPSTSSDLPDVPPEISAAAAKVVSQDGTLGEFVESVMAQKAEELIDCEITNKVYLERYYPELYELIRERHANYLVFYLEKTPLFQQCLLRDSKLKDFHYSFFGNFSCQHQLSFGNDLDVILRKFFFYNKVETDFNPWYRGEVDILLNKANFNTLEKIRFLAAFSNGPQIIADLVFNFGSAPFSVDNYIGLMIEDTVYSEFKPAEEEHPYVGASHVTACQRNPIREALSSISLLTNKEASHFFFVRAVNLILDQELSFNEDIKNMFKTSFNAICEQDPISVAVRFFSIYTNSAQNLPRVSQTRILKACFYTYSASILSSVLFNPAHKCTQKSVYQLMFKNLKSTNFCDVRYKLEFNNCDVSQCKFKNCLYCNDYMYYFVCCISVACKRYFDVDFVTNSVYVREDGSIVRSIRRRHAKRADSVFTNMALYLKHLFLCQLPNLLQKIFMFIVEWLPTVVMLALAFFALKRVAAVGSLAFTGACAFGSFAYDVVSGRNKTSSPPQANYFKFDTPKPSNSPKHTPPGKFTAAPQASGHREALVAKIQENVAILFAEWRDAMGVPRVQGCRCLFIQGNALLVLRHYLEEFSGLVNNYGEVVFNIYFARNTKMAKSQLSFQDLTNVAWCSNDSNKLTSNYGILMLPKFIPPAKSILKYIASVQEHDNVSSTIDMYTVNGENYLNMPIEVVRNFRVNATASSSPVYMALAYSYKKQYSGLCGTVCVSPTLGSGMGRIIGLHVAGSKSSDTGYAEPLYYNTLAEFFNVNPVVDVLPLPTVEEVTPNLELDANLMFYGCVPKNFAQAQIGVSQIVPSLLANKIYPTCTEVNPLLPNDPRQPPGSHPLRDGCNKHGSSTAKIYDPKLVSLVEENIKGRFRQIVKPVRSVVKPLTLSQAVVGDTNVPYFDSLNWTSSEGFPLVKHRPGSAHDKRWLFDLELSPLGYVFKGLHPKLDSQLKLRDMCFERNIKPPTIYIDCLKDTRLPKEKCKIPGKTRIFSIAPVQCSIDIRMFVNDFCASIKNSRIENSIGIGINPDSLEWTKLVNYLFEVGPHIITLDYSNFGPNLISQLVASSCNVIVDWFKYNGADDNHVRRVDWLLSNDILNPVHLASNVVYQTLNGIASGSPLTGECNSIPNLYYMKLSYLEIMLKHMPEFATLYYFDQFIRLVVYGDDLIMSVSPTIISVFNAFTVRDALALHGITVTSAQKDSEMLAFSDIYNSTFLKRSFTPHPYRPNVWLAPVDIKSVTECINWCSSKGDKVANTVEVCRASMDLAYGHGPIFYAEHYSKLVKELNLLNVKFFVQTWHERDAEIFGGNDIKTYPTSLSFKNPWTKEISSSTMVNSNNNSNNPNKKVCANDGSVSYLEELNGSTE